MATDKKVMLITGAGGRIGTACIHRFKDKYHVIGFDRHEAEKIEGMEHMTMDVSTDASVNRALDKVKEKYGNKIGPVIHLAAYYSFSGGSPEMYNNITVLGTLRMLRKLQEFEVDQFMFASTLLVHAPCEIGEKINEDSPIEPKWAYPKSKVKTEHIMHEEHGDIPIVIMRIAGCYDDLCHSIPIAHNVQRIYQHELDSHLFPGNIRHGNPFLHIEDQVDAFEYAINRQKELPSELTLLIGEDRTVGYGELQNLISEILDHRDYRVYRIPKWIAKEGAWVEDHLPFFEDSFIQPWMVDVADDHYALDVTRAKETIGWEPKHFVKDHLPVMLELLKTDPIEWYRTNLLKPPHWLEKTVAEEKANVKTPL